MIISGASRRTNEVKDMPGRGRASTHAYKGDGPMNGLTRFPVHLAQISPGGSYELPGGAHLQHLIQISSGARFRGASSPRSHGAFSVNFHGNLMREHTKNRLFRSPSAGQTKSKLKSRQGLWILLTGGLKRERTVAQRRKFEEVHHQIKRRLCPSPEDCTF